MEEPVGFSSNFTNRNHNSMHAHILVTKMLPQPLPHQQKNDQQTQLLVTTLTPNKAAASTNHLNATSATLKTALLSSLTEADITAGLHLDILLRTISLSMPH
jgi:hypothetical protein